MSEALDGEVVNQSTPIHLTKTKHDEQIVELLEAAFHNGFNITEACQYAQITRTTYYDWLGDDDIFSYRMSVAQAAPLKKAKEIVIRAIQAGDPNLALRYLTLRDPDFKPKAELDTNPNLDETRNKIKDFLDENSPDDVSEQSTSAPISEPRGEVADAPTDIS